MRSACLKLALDESAKPVLEQLQRLGGTIVIGDRHYLPRFWVDERKRGAAMLAIDRKIGIECQHSVPLIELGHSYDTGVGERHRPVTIFLMQTAQRRDMLLDPKGDLERTVFEQRGDSVLGFG